MLRWLFRQTIDQAKAVELAARHIHRHGGRVVADEEFVRDEGKIPYTLDGVELQGKRWHVWFERILPTDVYASHPFAEVVVNTETGEADFVRLRSGDPIPKPPPVQMTEREWLATSDPERMLTFRWEAGSERKFRLSACAGCRASPSFARDEPLRRAVAAMEDLADGHFDETTRPRYNTFDHHTLICNLGAARGFDAARQTAFHLANAPAGHMVIPEALCQLLACIFGNPFRPVAFAPAWQTPTAAALAQQMYDARDFAALPILADALQDVGCEQVDVLDHCRGLGPHVRGCWVVDHVLGKG